MVIRNLLAAMVIAAMGANKLIAEPASAPAEGTQKTLGAGDDGKTITLKDEKTVVFELAGNATTGFAWSVAKIEGDLLAQHGDVEYKPHAAPPGMVGGGGMYRVVFDVKKGTKGMVKLEYKRAWEKDIPAAKTVTVNFAVEGAK